MARKGWALPGGGWGPTWKALSSSSLSAWSRSWSESLKMRVRAWAHAGFSCGDSQLSMFPQSHLLATPAHASCSPAWCQGHREELWGAARPSVRSRTAPRCSSGSWPSTGNHGDRLRGARGWEARRCRHRWSAAPVPRQSSIRKLAAGPWPFSSPPPAWPYCACPLTSTQVSISGN